MRDSRISTVIKAKMLAAYPGKKEEKNSPSPPGKQRNSFHPFQISNISNVGIQTSSVKKQSNGLHLGNRFHLSWREIIGHQEHCNLQGLMGPYEVVRKFLMPTPLTSPNPESFLQLVLIVAAEFLRRAASTQRYNSKSKADAPEAAFFASDQS